MKRLWLALVGALVFSQFASGACALWAQVQWSDSNGNPLVGGQVFTYLAGTTTAATTFTSSTCTTAAANPVVLNGGGFGQIWLDTAVTYKFLVTTSAGATIITLDGVSVGSGGGGGGGGGGSSSWTVSGVNQYSAVAGNVGVGTNLPIDKLTVDTGNLSVRGGSLLKLWNSDPTAHFVAQAALASMANDYTVSWPLALPVSTGCVKMSSAGLLTVDTACTAAPTDTIWSVSGNNVTLANGAHSVSQVTVHNQTAMTGLTQITNVSGAGQSTFAVIRYRRNDGNPDVGGVWVTAAGDPPDAYVEMPIFHAAQDVNTNPAGSLSYVQGLQLASSLKIRWSPDATSFGAWDACMSRASAGRVIIENCAGASRDLTVRDLTVEGTCTGCGGGGGGAPFSDAAALVYNQADATKTMRFDLGGFTTGVLRTLTPQNNSYVIAGTNISNTFTSQQIVSGTSLLMSGSDILANGTVNLGTTGARLTDGFFTNLNSGTFLVNDGLTTWRIALSGGQLAIADQVSALLATVSTTPKQWTFYGAVMPSGTNTHALGSSSLVWNGLWSKSVDIYGTTSGATYPLAVRDTGGSPGINFYRSTSTKSGGLSSGATAALAVQDSADNARMVVFQNGNVAIGTATDNGILLNVAGQVSATASSTGTLMALINTHVGGGGVIGAFSSSTNGTSAVNAVSAGAQYAAYSANANRWFSGSGAPSHGCASGDFYSRNDGGVNTSFYICQSGTWYAVTP